MSTPPLTPLTLVALEIGGDAGALAVKFADSVTLDEAGLRCVPTDTAHQFIANHRAAVQAQRDRQAAKREAAKRRPFPLRERVRALHRQQERFDGADLPALAVMTADDIEGRQAASAERMNEMLGGEPGVLVRHPIGRPGGDR